MLLRIDEHKQSPSPEVREEIMAHLREATARLIASQSPEGYWDQNWPNAKTTAKDESLTRCRDAFWRRTCVGVVGFGAGGVASAARGAGSSGPVVGN